MPRPLTFTFLILLALIILFVFVFTVPFLLTYQPWDSTLTVPADTRLAICLSTVPNRVEKIERVLLQLSKMQLPIYLSLAKRKQLTFPQVEETEPVVWPEATVTRLQEKIPNLVVLRPELARGPGTKITGVLESSETTTSGVLPENDIFLVLDDDYYYPSYYLRYLCRKILADKTKNKILHVQDRKATGRYDSVVLVRCSPAPKFLANASVGKHLELRVFAGETTCTPIISSPTRGQN